MLLTDIVGSTEKVAALGDAAWTIMIARQRELASREIDRFRGRWVDSAGDGIFAIFDGPARAVRCAQAISRSARRLGLQIRAGCHTGEVELLGEGGERSGGAHRAGIAALAGADEVWVSSTVRDPHPRAPDSCSTTSASNRLKGVADPWLLLRVADGTDG